MAIGAESAGAREQLSALADGELDPAAVARACAAWRDDPAAQSTWHAYHLIGDVLRSEDLASSPALDASFLTTLRSRLAEEPVVLAPEVSEPAPLQARTVHAAVSNERRAPRWGWMAPSAVAAGFVAVAGVLMVTRSPAPDVGPTPDASVVAQPALVKAPLQIATAPAPAASELSQEPHELVANGKLIRDVRLDRYLTAHKQFAGGSAIGAPSGFLRNAAVETPNR